MVTLSRRSAVRTFPTPRTSLLSRIRRAGRRTLQGAFVAVVAALMAIGAAATGAIAQTCQPAWTTGFGGNVGNPGLGDASTAMVVFDDGSGPALYAGGYFGSAGGAAANNIAKWDGSVWSPLGSGVNNNSNNASVAALTVFDDGTGPALYAGGSFTTAGGVSASHIAKWDGSSWTPLGSGVNGDVFALTVFDDGTGPALYAGGFFTHAGGAPANYIAKWDGSTWTPLGSGVTNTVIALTVFDDGSGPALYAGGTFMTAGGVSANSIAKWDGSTWSPLGSGMSGFLGMSGTVRALTVFDDGSGPALYACGGFIFAGGVGVNNIAKWDGSTWSPLGSGINYERPTPLVFALTAFDDGAGPALYAGGFFTMAGGAAVNAIAKWDGSTWSPLGSGMIFLGGGNGTVFALTVFDDGTGPALFAGGGFITAGGIPASNIARWNGCAGFAPVDLNGDGVVDGADLAALLTQWGACPQQGACSADLNNDGVVNGADLSVLLINWGAV